MKRVRYNTKFASVVEDVTDKELKVLKKDKNIKKLKVLEE